MIFCSLLVLAFSLFPFLPDALGASPQVVWRISSGFLVLAGGAVAWVQLQYLRQVGWFRARSLYANVPLGLLVVLLLALNTLLDMGKLSSGIYIFALFSLLFVSGFLFLLAFLSFLSGRDP